MSFAVVEYRHFRWLWQFRQWVEFVAHQRGWNVYSLTRRQEQTLAPELFCLHASWLFGIRCVSVGHVLLAKEIEWLQRFDTSQHIFSYQAMIWRPSDSQAILACFANPNHPDPPGTWEYLRCR